MHVLCIFDSYKHSILAHDGEVNNLKSELLYTKYKEKNNERIGDLTIFLERVQRNHSVEMQETVRSMIREINILNFHFSSSSRSIIVMCKTKF